MWENKKQNKMARNFFNPDDRDDLLRRLERLTAVRERRWGTMTAAEMMCHLRDSVEIALGDRPAQQQGWWLMRTALGGWLALYVIPWRKGKEKAPQEMNQRRQGSQPVDFVEDKAALLRVLQRFSETRGEELAPHPYFGRFSQNAWGRMVWKHTDHHLRQFGL